MKMVKNRKKDNVAVKIAVIILGALLIVYSLSIIFMLLWGLLSSLKSDNDFMKNLLGLPTINNPEWFDRVNDPDSSYKTLFWLENYVLVIQRFNFPASTSFFVGNREVTHTTENNFFGMLLNSAIYAFGNGFVQAIIPAIMAYMCAKYQYKFSKVLCMTVIVVMTLPIVGAYPSELTLLRNLGLYDTWVGNFIQRCSFMGMYFLVFYEFFKGMPDTYSEAAEIDGASQFTVMFGIYIPLAAKIIGSVFLIRFIFFWNDFSSIELYMPTHPTLAYFIYALGAGKKISNDMTTNPRKIAACMILALPTLILFLILHNKVMGSMTLGGIKG